MSAKWHKQRVLRKIHEGGTTGLTAAAEAVFGESQRRVPRDTDQLAETGRIEVDKAKQRAVITYGTGLPDARAVIVHEKVEIHHDQGEAKYLENPLRELAAQTGEIIAANIRNKTG